MSLILFVQDTCPKCRKPIHQATIDLHPTDRDLALQNFTCANCGAVKTKMLSLKPDKPSSQLSASAGSNQLTNDFVSLPSQVRTGKGVRTCSRTAAARNTIR